MKRLLVLVFVALAGCMVALSSAGSRAEAAPPGAAQGLYAGSYCSGGSAVARVGWSPSGWGAQWVDVSQSPSFYGWQNAGPLASWQSSNEFYGLQPNTTYYSRVATWAGYWLVSDTVAFTTAACYTPPPVGPGPGYPPIGGPYGPGIPPGGYGCTDSSFPSNCPAPAQHCGGIVGIASADGVTAAMIGNQGCVWVTRGTGSSYAVGEPVVYCYWVSGPMYVNISARKPDGSTMMLANGNDDGRGDCIHGLVAGYPLGMRSVSMYGPNGQLLDSTNFYVR